MPSAPPEAIGRYTVERLLGQGGMGEVWLARDTVLGRRVAIKVLRRDLPLPPRVIEELTLRMRHEARAAAAVSHPHIVTLHDMGEDPEFGLFLVFEYVANRDEAPETLRDRLRDGPLELSEVAELARQLGSALSYAHAAGVIHRDVKPENILYSATGAKIADFGIARIPNSTLTRANTPLGTPAYTAPEALVKGTFGPATDQFSLAATLYEAATGRRAFDGGDAMKTAGKVTSEPPPPLADTLGNIPSVLALDQTLHRGMAKSAAERFASCRELGEEVERAIVSPPSVPHHELEFERTPLTSRANERVRVERPPMIDTPVRPSIVIRKKTHRFQNLMAATALLVIVVLIIFGRRSAPPAPATSEVDGGVDPARASRPRPHPVRSGRVAANEVAPTTSTPGVSAVDAGVDAAP